VLLCAHMSVQRVAASLPTLARSFRTSCQSLAEASSNGGVSKGGISHNEIVRGDGHHGLRPGYHYDWEHGEHYLRPDKVPNFCRKWNIVFPLLFGVALGIPVFTVWWQQSKLKAA